MRLAVRRLHLATLAIPVRRQRPAVRTQRHRRPRPHRRCCSTAKTGQRIGSWDTRYRKRFGSREGGCPVSTSTGFLPSIVANVPAAALAAVDVQTVEHFLVLAAVFLQPFQVSEGGGFIGVTELRARHGTPPSVGAGGGCRRGGFGPGATRRGPLLDPWTCDICTMRSIGD